MSPSLGAAVTTFIDDEIRPRCREFALARVDAARRFAAQPRLTTRQVLRGAVCLHGAALLLLPKDSFGLIAYRPEDLTGILMLAAVAGIAIVGRRVQSPHRSLFVLLIAYTAYLLAVLIVRDIGNARPQALVFWTKELSYLAFGYLVWWVYRSEPARLLRVLAIFAVPALLYGMFQIVTQPRGIYGVSPWGHETSPGSSGMFYFSCSLVMFVNQLFGRRSWRYTAGLLVSCVLVLMAGSKVAVLGAVSFYGWYLVQVALSRRDARSMRSVGLFVAASSGAIALAASLSRLGGSWNSLSRYSGFLDPVTVLMGRGIWWKVQWMDTPTSFFVGAGYSPGRIGPAGDYRFGMAMDNQVLFYLVTGGVIAIVLYVVLMASIYRLMPPRTPQGRVLRALVVSYVLMGLGAEVLQLSVHGNVFWLMVGIALAVQTRGAAAARAAVTAAT